MQKQNKKQTKRIRDLIVASTLAAILVATSTYAWFVGMQSVNVTNFEVEIKTTESLALSLDGSSSSWSSTIKIDSNNFSSDAYVGNTNIWSKLVPASTIGEMDATVSRMKLFEKASLTATPGGYRLMASRIDNTDATEKDGYVAFDLFIKNFSGTQYIEELEELDEEAIYLTVDSAVTVADSGIKNTGIENSVRLAFTQVGRVIGTETTQGKITGITCSDDAVNGVTGICRDAQIWEPNDKNHVAAAISWYNNSCVKRIAEDVTKTDSYLGNCETIADGFAYPTYAVRAPISSSQNIDVYDGAEYNTYTASIYHKDTNPTGLLAKYDYFTDTKKLQTGTSRPTFMTLAPNSITKVRVYIYIEGQDIDNYDFAQIGKTISIQFGFTKERFTDEDINYEGPALNVNAPVITLNGNKVVEVIRGTEYVDLGATATDLQDGDLTVETNTTNVNTRAVGSYAVVYAVTDEDGNRTVKTRIVNVVNE